MLTLIAFVQVEEYLVGETEEFPDDVDEDSICRSEEVCAGLEYLASKLRSDLECRPLTCFSDFETIVENSVGYAGEGGGGKGDGVDLEASFNWHYMFVIGYRGVIQAQVREKYVHQITATQYLIPVWDKT